MHCTWIVVREPTPDARIPAWSSHAANTNTSKNSLRSQITWITHSRPRLTNGVNRTRKYHPSIVESIYFTCLWHLSPLGSCRTRRMHGVLHDWYLSHFYDKLAVTSLESVDVHITILNWKIDLIGACLYLSRWCCRGTEFTHMQSYLRLLFFEIDFKLVHTQMYSSVAAKKGVIHVDRQTNCPIRIGNTRWS